MGKATTLGVASGLMITNGYPGELLVGMAGATNAETDPQVKSLIQRSQYWTVVSWLTYPVVAIQVGYCVSDIISKCGVGIVIYCVTDAKSEAAKDVEGGRMAGLIPGLACQ